MGRFWAGLVIATGCHLLILAAPVYRSSQEPLPLPTAKAISVRLNPSKPIPSPNETTVSLPPESIVLPQNEIEKPPPPTPEPVAVPPKPKPKPRKMVKKKQPVQKPFEPSPPTTPKVIQETPDPNPQLKPPSQTTHLVDPPTPEGPATTQKTEPPAAIANQAPISIRKAYPKNEGNPPPKYPMLARRRGWEGTVQLSVLVLENGRVGDISVVKSSGHPLLDTTALKTVAKYHFVPGLRGNQMVAMRVEVPVHFRLQNAD